MSILTILRDLAPHKRALTLDQAKDVAEQQARRFRQLTGHDNQPQLPNDAILDFPRLKVEMTANMRDAGLSSWNHNKRQYEIFINDADDPNCQRFTLGHELKHWIDYSSHKDHFQDFAVHSDSAKDQVEDVCEYFAGCLLVPRHLLAAAWNDGIRNRHQLSGLFGASKAVIGVRLDEAGIVHSGCHGLFRRRRPAKAEPLQPIDESEPEERL